MFLSAGRRNSTATLRVLLTAARTLPEVFVQHLGNIVNGGDPLAAYARTPAPPDTLDCRVYCGMLWVQSLKASKAFMAAQSDTKERDQINALYRLEHFYQMNNHKGCTGREPD